MTWVTKAEDFHNEADDPGWKVTSDGTMAWEGVSLFYVLMSDITGKSHNSLLMRDERWSTGCPLLVNREMTTTGMTARWEGDQDSTLVFCESTSCMLMTSVLTPLSYAGLSKADSSVMLSYGGEDVAILIDFPCSLRKEGWEKMGKHSERACFFFSL